jgi:hypothetical protein
MPRRSLSKKQIVLPLEIAVSTTKTSKSGRRFGSVFGSALALAIGSPRLAPRVSMAAAVAVKYVEMRSELLARVHGAMKKWERVFFIKTRIV